MLTINTNLSSLITQSNLKQSANGLNKAIERMTTGFKINGAKDNAAGYSISTQMSTKISAYQVAEDNAAMGLDLLTTANDSLALISEHLTRIRDLTTQAKNGTYGDESMKAINSEINARLDEIQRLYDTTEFNGLKLFGGAEENKTEGSSSTTSKVGFLQEVTKRDTSTMTTLASVDENTTISSGTYSISTAEELAKLATMTNNGKINYGCEFVLANDIDLSAYSTGEGWMPIGEYGNSFAANFDGNGHVVKNLYINRPTEDYQGLFGKSSSCVIKNLAVENASVIGNDYVGCIVGYRSCDGESLVNCSVTGKVSGHDSIGGLAGYLTTYEGSLHDCYTDVDVKGNDYVGGFVGKEDGNYYTGSSGLHISESFSAGNVSGNNFVGGFSGGVDGGWVSHSKVYSTGNVNGNDNVAGFLGGCNCDGVDSYYTGIITSKGSSNTSGALAPDAPKPFEYTPIIPKTPDSVPDTSIEIGGGVKDILFQIGIHSDVESQIALNTAFALTNLGELRNIGLSDVNYFETIDNLLASISAKQTEYGACQNRLESALEEINTHYENLLSSRSTLRDADVAKESSAYIRNQILQQASAALLATANQSPAIALQLI